MHQYSLSEIKKELKELPKDVLIANLLSLAKYKRESKEYLNYLLFQSHDEDRFVQEAKQEIENSFKEITQNNLYLVKKSLRKILRLVNRYAKYTGNKQREAELILHFLITLKDSGIPYHKNAVLERLYHTQLKKLQTCVSTLHEDLQYDFLKDMEQL